MARGKQTTEQIEQRLLALEKAVAELQQIVGDLKEVVEQRVED